MIILMFLLFLPVVYSGTLASSTITTYILEENFPSIDLFTDIEMHSRDSDSFHNWSLSRGCAVSDTNQNPKNSSVFSSFSYGVNYTTGCAFSSSVALSGNLPTNTTGSTIIITYNLSIQDHNSLGAPFSLVVRPHGDASETLVFTHGQNFTSGLSESFSADLSGTGIGGNCNLTNNLSFPLTSAFTIIIDQNLETYSWYIDGESNGNCENVVITGGHNIVDLGIGHILLNLRVEEDVFTETYVDDLKMGIGSADTSVGSSEECPFPLLFCDNFNYNTPLQGNDWLIFNWGDRLNNTFAPIDNVLALDDTSIIKAFHETQVFETTYFPDSDGRFLRHYLAPVFSSEFILNFNNNTDNQLKYSAFEKQGRLAWTLRVTMDDNGGNASGDMDWDIRNKSSPIEWSPLCQNCTFSGTDIPVKINTFFKQRDSFPFNSSVTQDEVRVYANGNILGTIFNLVDGERVEALKQYEFAKTNEGNYTIDNYNVMVGTDTLIDTTENFYDDFFDNVTSEQEIIFDTDTGELIDAVHSIWADMGLQTQGSRIFAGISLMFLLALILFGASLSMGMHPSALVIGILEFFFMIVLVYIKLLPIWIPFVIVLITAGIGALMFKMASG